MISIEALDRKCQDLNAALSKIVKLKGKLLAEKYKVSKLEAGNKELKSDLVRLNDRLLLSESQNYCKMCGKTLDGYVPKVKERLDKDE